MSEYTYAKEFEVTSKTIAVSVNEDGDTFEIWFKANVEGWEDYPVRIQLSNPEAANIFYGEAALNS